MQTNNNDEPQPLIKSNNRKININYGHLAAMVIFNNNLTFLKIILGFNVMELDYIINQCLDVIYSDNGFIDYLQKQPNIGKYIQNIIMVFITSCYQSNNNIMKNLSETGQKIYESLHNQLNNICTKIKQNSNKNNDVTNMFTDANTDKNNDTSIKPNEPQNKQSMDEQRLFYDITIFQQLLPKMKEQKLLMYQNESLKYFLKTRSLLQPNLLINLILQLFDNSNNIYTQLMTIPAKILQTYLIIIKSIDISQFTNQCFSTYEINTIIANTIISHFNNNTDKIFSSVSIIPLFPEIDNVLSSAQMNNFNELGHNLQLFIMSIFSTNNTLMTLLQQYVKNNGNNAQILLNVTFTQLMVHCLIFDNIHIITILLQIPINIIQIYVHKINEYIDNTQLNIVQTTLKPEIMAEYYQTSYTSENIGQNEEQKQEQNEEQNEEHYIIPNISLINQNNLLQHFLLTLIGTAIISHFSFINIHLYIEQIIQILQDQPEITQFITTNDLLDFAYNLYENLGNTIQSNYPYKNTEKAINRQIQIEIVCDYLWPKIKQYNSENELINTNMNKSIQTYLKIESKRELFIKLFNLCINTKNAYICNKFVTIPRNKLIQSINISEQTLLDYTNNNISTDNSKQLNMKQIIDDLLLITIDKIIEPYMSEIEKTMQQKPLTDNIIATSSLYGNYTSLLTENLSKSIK